jgi:hypothetical protein
MANLLFYKKPVPLNKTDHAGKKINPAGRTFKFASGTNSVIIAGVEFSEAAKEYPIVFAQAGESVVPVALLGLRNEENLYVDDEGTWDARYVPAFVRRYPFVLAETGQDGQRVVCIDEAYEGFNDTEGEPLFDGEETTPILKQAMDFLEEYQKQYQRTEAFVQRLKENELLMELNAKVDMVDGQQFGLSGLLAVDERKLLQMPDDRALQLFRSGELSWIYCHLMSLGNMGRMVDRIARRSGAPTTSDDSDSEENPKPKAKARAKKTS